MNGEIKAEFYLHLGYEKLLLTLILSLTKKMKSPLKNIYIDRDLNPIVSIRNLTTESRLKNKFRKTGGIVHIDKRVS